MNRIGERIVLGTGIGIVAVSSALAGLAGNYGAAAGAARDRRGRFGDVLGVGRLVAARVTSSGQRGRSMGAFSGGFLIGGIAGPGLGGLVTGWSLRAPFFLYAGTLAAAGAVGIALLPRHGRRSGDDPARPAQSPLTVPQAFRLPAFRAAAAANLADNWASVGVRAAMVPLLVVEVLHRSPIWTGIGLTVFTLANVATLLLGSRFTDRRGRRPVLLAGCLGSAAGCALLMLHPSLPLFLVAMVVFGAGSGLLDVAPGAMLGDVLGGRGGTVVASYQMAGDLGSLSRAAGGRRAGRHRRLRGCLRGDRGSAGGGRRDRLPGAGDLGSGCRSGQRVGATGDLSPLATMEARLERPPTARSGIGTTAWPATLDTHDLPAAAGGASSRRGRLAR